MDDSNLPRRRAARNGAPIGTPSITYRPTVERLDLAEDAEERELRAVLLRLNARAWGIAMGLLLGGGLFIATNALVLKGGAVVGPHLALLGVYLPGYRVTFVGSLVGFVYMFVIGYGLGRLVGVVYNALADRAG